MSDHLITAFQRWREDLDANVLFDGPAVLAFYFMMSVFPAGLALVGIGSFFLSSNFVEEELLSFLFKILPTFERSCFRLFKRHLAPPRWI